MPNQKVSMLRPRAAAQEMASGHLGWIVEVDKAGRATVDYPGNTHGPMPARSAIRLRAGELEAAGARPAVLLLFEDRAARRPVIVGLVGDSLLAPREPETVVESDRLVFSGRREVVIRCGDGSITLTADGRLVIKGRELVSRAKELNRIRGATVAIN